MTCNLALKGEVAPILDHLANHSVSLTILVVVILGGVCSCFCEGINPRSSAHSQNHGTLTESMLCPYMEFPDYVMSKHAHMWTLPNMGISRYVLNIDNIGTGISMYGHETYVN